MQAEPSDIVGKIKATSLMNRVRITEFFYDFDKLRKGNVTKDQFRRILSMQGFELTEDEYKALEAKYGNSDNGMKYVDFCTEVDSVFTVKGLDKDPLKRIHQPGVADSLKARRKRMDLDEASKKKLYDALKIASKLALTQRFHMKPFFQAFDTTQCSYVSKTQFTRVLSQAGLKPTEDTMNIILKYYMNRGNLDEVNYVDFINDVDKPEDIYLIEEKEVSLAAAERVLKRDEERKNRKMQIASRRPEDVEDVLALIRRRVKQERMRIAEFLRDFDKLRSGAITASQLRLGLKMAKIDLSNAEFDKICEHFAAPVQGKVQWMEFVDSVEEVFTHKGLEQTPTVPVEPAKTELKYGKHGMTAQDLGVCAKVTERFSYLPFTRDNLPFSQYLIRENLDIKSFFQLWDRHNHFKVSPKQFRQVMASCGFDITDQEYFALIAHYKEQTSGDVMYMIFLHDAWPEKYQLESGKLAATTAVKFGESMASTEKELPLDKLMTKVKNVVKQRQIRVEEFFLDHDSLRKGDVSVGKFKSCLDMLKMDLKAEDYETLIKAFKSQHDPAMVNYAKFIDEINRIFTLPELEKDPVLKIPKFSVTAVLDPEDVLSGEEEKLVDGCMKRLGEIVRKRKLHVKPMFQAKVRRNEKPG